MSFSRPLFSRNVQPRRWAIAFIALLLIGGGVAQPASADSTAAAGTAAVPTGTLTVMIITISGQKLPLANVVVGLYGPLQFTVTQRTDATGQTTFTGIPAGSQYTVHVSQRGDQGAWTRLSNYKENVVVAAGHHLWQALRMRLAGSIGGRIVNQSGVPVANEMVRARGALTRASEYDYTDADGYYVIRGLLSDSYRVEIVDDPGSPQIIRRVVPVEAQHGDVAQTFANYINGVLQQPYPTT